MFLKLDPKYLKWVAGRIVVRGTYVGDYARCYLILSTKARAREIKMTTKLERLAKLNEKKEGAKFIVDPEAMGVKLDTPGNPTSKGWSVVTPEAWKFRFSIEDKLQVDEPEYFSDVEGYVDMTPYMAMKEIYKENPDMPIALLVASYFTRCLDEQAMFLRPNEMIIGFYSSDPHGIVGDPQKQNWFSLELAWQNAPNRLKYWENGERKSITQEQMDDIRDTIGNNFNAVYIGTKKMTDEEKNKYFCPQHPGRYLENYGSVQRANPDHDWYVALGWRKLVDMKKEKLEEYQKEFDRIYASESLNYKGTDVLQDKINNAKASIMVGEAVIRWTKRYADFAREKAAEMPDEKSRLIAEQIAENCDVVAEKPPETFWQSIQMHWLSYCVYHGLESCHPGAYKPDRVFWPWYEKDVVKDKTLDRTTAAEILSCYAAKQAEASGWLSRFSFLGKAGMGTRDFSVWTVGGQTRYGRDATNDLTRLLLDVYDGYRFHFPDLKFRWFPGTKKSDFRRVCEVARTGLGLPSLRNDPLAIETLLSMYPGEMTLEQAREWAIVGCNTPASTVDSKGPVRREAQYANIELAPILALYNGHDPAPGFEWFTSVETGDPRTFKTFDEFYQAWLKQYEWLSAYELRYRNMFIEILEKTNRMPFMSLLYESCMDSGLDALNDPTISRLSFQSIVGWVDSIDMLVGLKYWVYDKKKYTMVQVMDALDADWVGFDKMRDDFRKAPKFGTDNDYADDMMIRATEDTYKMCEEKLRDVDGNPVWQNVLPVTRMWAAAETVGAAPNGRKRGDPLCDGGINPHAEFDSGGAWSRLRSALKVDQSKSRAYIYNQKLDYSSVEGEAGLDKFADYCLTSMRQGQTQMQFNFSSTDLLRSAQNEPEKYPYLSVRVSGYNAYFTVLPEFVQEAVIDRVEQAL